MEQEQVPQQRQGRRGAAQVQGPAGARAGRGFRAGLAHFRPRWRRPVESGAGASVFTSGSRSKSWEVRPSPLGDLLFGERGSRAPAFMMTSWRACWRTEAAGLLRDGNAVLGDEGGGFCRVARESGWGLLLGRRRGLGLWGRVWSVGRKKTLCLRGVVAVARVHGGARSSPKMPPSQQASRSGRVRTREFPQR